MSLLGGGDVAMGSRIAAAWGSQVVSWAGPPLKPHIKRSMSIFGCDAKPRLF